MSKNTKIIVISCLVIFSILFLTSNIINTHSKTSNGVHLANSETFTGDYDGDLSIMYFYQDFRDPSWLFQNTSTEIIPHNASIQGYEFTVNILEIRVFDLLNLTGEFIIANNISNQISLNESLAFTQEFTAHDLIGINEINIYLNYSLMGPLTDEYVFILQIYDENFQEQIDIMWRYESRSIVDEWVSFIPHPYIFEPGQKYNLLFLIIVKEGDLVYTNDFWKAEKYKDSSFNKGITGSLNETGWTQIDNDDTIDMLCNFTYIKLILMLKVKLLLT